MSFQPHYAGGNDGTRPGYRDWSKAEKRPASTRDKAIEAASRCFSVQEYQALVQDLDSGRVDIRLFEDWIFLTWNH